MCEHTLHLHSELTWAIHSCPPGPPAGLSVGLDPGGFGSSEFCWLSVEDSVMWSVAGPFTAVLTVCPSVHLSLRQHAGTFVSVLQS